MGEEKRKNSLAEEFKELGGLPWWLYLICAVVVIWVAFTGTLGYDAMAFVAVTTVLAIILNKFGKILPIWNTYIGGGLLMVFFGTAVLKQLNLIPEGYVEWEYCSGRCESVKYLYYFAYYGLDSFA